MSITLFSTTATSNTLLVAIATSITRFDVVRSSLEYDDVPQLEAPCPLNQTWSVDICRHMSTSPS